MIVNPISYPGNKNKLLSQIIPELPNNCSQIVEIFCGSGVVSINSNINSILLNDISNKTKAGLTRNELLKGVPYAETANSF